MKKIKTINNLLRYPTPVVMVSLSDFVSVDNIITIAWTGIVCSSPPCISISIKPNRYSHDIIKQTGVFGINIPSFNMLSQTDICGTISGRDQNKFELCNFTKFFGSETKVPLIEECAVNYECKVVNSIKIGSHTMFIGQLLSKYHMEDTNLDDFFDTIAYVKPNYLKIRQGGVGTHGFSNKI